MVFLLSTSKFYPLSNSSVAKDPQIKGSASEWMWQETKPKQRIGVLPGRGLRRLVLQEVFNFAWVGGETQSPNPLWDQTLEASFAHAVDPSIQNPMHLNMPIIFCQRNAHLCRASSPGLGQNQGSLYVPFGHPKGGVFYPNKIYRDWKSISQAHPRAPRKEHRLDEKRQPFFQMQILHKSPGPRDPAGILIHRSVNLDAHWRRTAPLALDSQRGSTRSCQAI